MSDQEPRWHGPDLDAAMDAAAGPDDMDICETALGSRVTALIDRQIDLANDPDEIEKIRLMYADEGVRLTTEEAAGMGLRSVIGGAFTWGLAVGLALAEQETER